MAFITGAQIIERVTDTLQDKDNIRWPRAELLRYINDAQREIVLRRPDSSSKVASVLLSANDTKQSIPADGARLLEVTRNMGTGATPGRSIRLTAREVLDAQVPLWHQSGPTAVISHFVFDVRVPRTFYVYPRPTSNVYVELQYSAAPVDLATENDVLTLDDIYANAVIAYTIMRAYQKDEDYARNLDAAGAWAAMFSNSLDIRTQADGAVNPNNNLGMDKSR